MTPVSDHEIGRCVKSVQCLFNRGDLEYFGRPSGTLRGLLKESDSKGVVDWRWIEPDDAAFFDELTESVEGIGLLVNLGEKFVELIVRTVNSRSQTGQFTSFGRVVVARAGTARRSNARMSRRGFILTILPSGDSRC